MWNTKLHPLDDKNRVKTRCMRERGLGEWKKCKQLFYLGLDIIDVLHNTARSKSSWEKEIQLCMPGCTSVIMPSCRILKVNWAGAMKEKETVPSFWRQWGFWSKMSLALVKKPFPPLPPLSCSAPFCCSLLFFFSLNRKTSKLVYGWLFCLDKNNDNKTKKWSAVSLNLKLRPTRRHLRGWACYHLWLLRKDTACLHLLRWRLSVEMT